MPSVAPSRPSCGCTAGRPTHAPLEFSCFFFSVRRCLPLTLRPISPGGRSQRPARRRPTAPRRRCGPPAGCASAPGHLSAPQRARQLLAGLCFEAETRLSFCLVSCMARKARSSDSVRGNSPMRAAAAAAVGTSAGGPISPRRRAGGGPGQRTTRAACCAAPSVPRPRRSPAAEARHQSRPRPARFRQATAASQLGSFAPAMSPDDDDALFCLGILADVQVRCDDALSPCPTNFALAFGFDVLLFPPESSVAQVWPPSPPWHKFGFDVLLFPPPLRRSHSGRRAVRKQGRQAL